MKYEYVIIEPNGNEEHFEVDEKPDLKQLQEIVGGNIQLVACKYLSTIPVESEGDDQCDDKHMIINEEGKLRRLEVNYKATDWFEEKYAGTNDMIVGRAVVFKNFELD